MEIHVITNDGKLDITNLPNELEFDEFWKAIGPYFSSIGSSAKAAAKLAWKQALVEFNSMKKFRIYWRYKEKNGERAFTDVEGLDFPDACRRAGFGYGATRAIDTWKPLSE